MTCLLSESLLLFALKRLSQDGRWFLASHISNVGLESYPGVSCATEITLNSFM